jgi:hypothetical protein
MRQCSTCKDRLSLDLFYKRKGRKGGLSVQCKKCETITIGKYQNSEHGFMLRLYLRIKSRVNHSRGAKMPENEKSRIRCYMTKEEFLMLWEKHKLKYGYKCALSGEEIFHKTTGRNETNKSNSISVDRLNPRIGYTKENTIFVSNKVNNMKNAVTKELCIAIVKAHEEKGL